MFAGINFCSIFALVKQMVVVAQLVRVSVCGAEGRRFEPGLPPIFKALNFPGLFLFLPFAN